MLFGFMSAFDNGVVSNKIVAGLPRGSANAALFLGRSPQEAINELYLSDLKSVITKNWPPFSPYFGQKAERFEMNMDTINIARRIDAHAKPLSDEDKLHFLNSYSWFSNILAKVPGLI